MPTLRTLAEKNGLYYGAAVGKAFWKDEEYRKLLARECNILVAENCMKWKWTQPERDTFTFEEGDDLVAFAQEHGMKMRGHCGLWHQAVPEWLENAPPDRDTMLAIMEKHISTVFGRYRGKVAAWDVVNEAIDDEDSVFLRKTLWLERVGEDYLDSAFHLAHRAAPDAKLYYNDYSAEGMNAKSGKVYEMVKGMLERGVPVHGVGLQCHFDCRKNLTAEMAQNIARLHALGLEVSITELDFRMELPSDSVKVAEQAQRYREMISLVRQAARTMTLLSPPDYLLAAAGWTLVNSLMEEYVYRWFVLRQLRAVTTDLVAVLGSALVFTAHHVVAVSVYLTPALTVMASLGVFLGGAAWSWLYLRYRSIWPPWISHVLADVAVFVIGWHLLFG